MPPIGSPSHSPSRSSSPLRSPSFSENRAPELPFVKRSKSETDLHGEYSLDTVQQPQNEAPEEREKLYLGLEEKIRSLVDERDQAIERARQAIPQKAKVLTPEKEEEAIEKDSAVLRLTVALNAAQHEMRATLSKQSEVEAFGREAAKAADEAEQNFLTMQKSLEEAESALQKKNEELKGKDDAVKQLEKSIDKIVAERDELHNANEAEKAEKSSKKASGKRRALNRETKILELDTQVKELTNRHFWLSRETKNLSDELSESRRCFEKAQDRIAELESSMKKEKRAYTHAIGQVQQEVRERDVRFRGFAESMRKYEGDILKVLKLEGALDRESRDRFDNFNPGVQLKPQISTSRAVEKRIGAVEKYGQLMVNTAASGMSQPQFLQDLRREMKAGIDEEDVERVGMLLQQNEELLVAVEKTNGEKEVLKKLAKNLVEGKQKDEGRIREQSECLQEQTKHLRENLDKISVLSRRLEIKKDLLEAQKKAFSEKIDGLIKAVEDGNISYDEMKAKLVAVLKNEAAPTPGD